MKRFALLSVGLAFLTLAFTLPVDAAFNAARPSLANRDCSFVNGICTNPTSACTTSGGSCALPFTDDSGDGDDDTGFGWEDPNGDGCGCQI